MVSFLPLTFLADQRHYYYSLLSEYFFSCNVNLKYHLSIDDDIGGAMKFPDRSWELKFTLNSLTKFNSHLDLSGNFCLYI